MPEHANRPDVDNRPIDPGRRFSISMTHRFGAEGFHPAVDGARRPPGGVMPP
jgi:hypothetical protein